MEVGDLCLNNGGRLGRGSCDCCGQMSPGSLRSSVRAKQALEELRRVRDP